MARAYGEIVEFERTLAAEGMIIVKFWMHVSEEEQLRRFQGRANDPLRAWKLTDEDWRNRERRPQYEAAVEEMLRRTDHPKAPWHVVAGDDKRRPGSRWWRRCARRSRRRLQAEGRASSDLVSEHL